MSGGREEALVGLMRHWPWHGEPERMAESRAALAADLLAAADRWDHDNGWQRVKLDDPKTAEAVAAALWNTGWDGMNPPPRMTWTGADSVDRGAMLAAARAVLAVLRQQPGPDLDGGQTQQPQEQQQ